MENEITFELTDFCPNHCKFCSSNVTDSFQDATFLFMGTIKEILSDKQFEHIILSGGEPLSHPNFYNILQLCKEHSDDVVVYSNEITHLVYNLHVIDGVYLEANVTPTSETDKIHILRRVKQGKEKDRPEVHFSRNHHEDCSCENHVVRPDGTVTRSPCDKYFTVAETEGLNRNDSQRIN